MIKLKKIKKYKKIKQEIVKKKNQITVSEEKNKK
jgi:hypothetical protein